MSEELSKYIPKLETITPADYYRNDPAPTPPFFQLEGINYCIHDHLKGNCRHKECPHYAPHQKEQPK